jgi:hypothetical protein
MKQFLLVYRSPATSAATQLSPDEAAKLMKPWVDGMGSLAAQNKLVDRGQRLADDGNVIKPKNVITNGPYVELKEAVGGFSIIQAADLKEASELAKGCPIMATGGSVEVRAIVPM